MAEEHEKIEVRSDEVQEILSSVPVWMIRWGITLIFVIILLFIGLSYFIKYPDVIKGTVTLTTVTPPAKLTAKTNGEIEQIFVQDEEKVKKGDAIAQIRNPLSKDAVKYLEGKINEVEHGLTISFKDEIEFIETDFVFGAVQNDYNELVRSVSDYQLSLNNNQFEKRRAILRKQISNYRKLDKISDRQLSYADDNLKKAEDKFLSNKKLYEQNVISKVEFYNQEREFTQVKNEIENLKRTNVQNAITLTDYERQLNELDFELLSQKTTLTKSIETRLKNISNQINSWQETYLLIAPIDGTVNYLVQLSENKFVESGSQLFAIVPDTKNDFIGYLKIDKRGYGKVEVGQNVKIKLDNFPSNEYGQITGEVQKISLIPNEEKYLVQVVLTDGLMSTYNKQLIYTPEMTGQADIITEDLRILERIFNQFREIFDD